VRQLVVDNQGIQGDKKGVCPSKTINQAFYHIPISIPIEDQEICD
jgi:hypothetical protein